MDSSVTLTPGSAPNQGGSSFAIATDFTNWLSDHIAMRGVAKRKDRLIAFDVGAHRGKFFQPLLANNKIDQLYLFEAHPKNADWLRENLSDSRITLEEVAVGESKGNVNFQIGEDSATGSMLNPTELTPKATYEHSVERISLDDYARQNKLTDQVGLLKIDTQGSDLDVLKGAKCILQSSRPLIVAELIFAPLYTGQNIPTELMAWLFDQGYQLGGFFDEHFSREGWISWTNACFFPRSESQSFTPPFKTIKRKKNKSKFNKLFSSFRSK